MGNYSISLFACKPKAIQWVLGLLTVKCSLKEHSGQHKNKRCPSKVLGACMYVRMSSEARAETMWMHAQATHPQTNSEKVMLLACSVLKQIIMEYKRAG